MNYGKMKKYRDERKSSYFTHNPYYGLRLPAWQQTQK